MKKWMLYAEKFWKNKAFMGLLALTAVCSYGFVITHGTVGIDDTPYAYYFEEGLAAIVGRWVLFLLNKVVHIAEFAPFLTDLAGVLVLVAAVVVWSILFYSLWEKAVPWWGYFFFAAIFLSCPLISEVYTYYLHNGIAIGYLCSGISLCCFREGLLRLGYQSTRQGLQSEKLWAACRGFAGSAVFLWIAIGCYESFMIVWLLGILLLLLSGRLAGERSSVWGALLLAACTAIAGMVLRGVMIWLVTKCFGLEYLQEAAVQRSITEMAGWLLEPGAMSEFAMVLKRMFVMYGVFAYAYYPIAVFVLAAGFLLLFGLYRSIRQRDVWVLLLTGASLATVLLLAVIEGKATLYRSAQFLPVICGYGALLFVYAVKGLSGKLHRAGFLAAGLLGVIVWNQCADMNRWFYVDYEKYEAAKELTGRVAYELQKHYDITKPVLFTGTYEAPQGIIQAAYVEYNSEVYYKMKRITDKVDKDLLDKFNRSYGVWVAQTPALSVIDWGKTAFGTDKELVKFFSMHGCELQPVTEEELYATAEQYAATLPKFPKEGSIVDMGDYLLVHF